MSKTVQKIYQFKISLNGSRPLIWRRIIVPLNYSFYDLHVAIQDAMGWRDYHLHSFEIKKPYTNRKVEIGIPDEEYESFGKVVLFNRNEKIADYFSEINKTCRYEYDFGDS